MRVVVLAEEHALAPVIAPPPRRRASSGPFLLQLFKQTFHGRWRARRLSVLGLHSIDVSVEGFDLSRDDVGAGEIIKGRL